MAAAVCTLEERGEPVSVMLVRSGNIKTAASVRVRPVLLVNDDEDEPGQWLHFRPMQQTASIEMVCPADDDAYEVPRRPHDPK